MRSIILGAFLYIFRIYLSFRFDHRRFDIGALFRIIEPRRRSKSDARHLNDPADLTANPGRVSDTLPTTLTETPGADSRWFSPQAAADGRYLDPTAPEFLMFDGGMDSAVTQGAMFVQEAPGNHLESPFDSAVWSHYHSMSGGACFEHGVVSETKPKARRCPSPLVYGDESPDMLHVWFVTGVPAFSTSMTTSSEASADHHHS